MHELPPMLSWSIDDEPGRFVLRLAGELDAASIGAVEAALFGPASSTIVLDLERLRFIDAVGLAALVRAKKRIEQRGGRLLVRNANGLVDRVLTLGDVRAYLLGG